MEGNDTVWSRLATRAIRVLLARKEVSYARLAAELSRLGQTESGRSAEGKIQRGLFRFSFFLQSLVALGADCPPHWAAPLSSSEDWSERASTLMLSELKTRPWLTWAELSRRLESIGEKISPESLADEVRQGDFSAALFLQCAVVGGFDGLELFLDRSDLAMAAQRGMTPPGSDTTPFS
ncbi:DUF6471 domain-containing protein [Paraburkholderia azotifigens]